jgi:2-polyprenyl-6-methoxyphenol hydroxylase-like FAD-dependent oxidoreductase
LSDEADRYVEEKLALIGNSAHITQGFGLLSENISLNDAALLANALIKAKKDG